LRGGGAIGSVLWPPCRRTFGPVGLGVVLGVLLGALIGARLMVRMKAATVRRLFIPLVLYTAAMMIYKGVVRS